jgi:hypothetical protein
MKLGIVMVAIPAAPRSRGSRAEIGSATIRIRPSSIQKASHRGTTLNVGHAVTNKVDVFGGFQRFNDHEQ